MRIRRLERVTSYLVHGSLGDVDVLGKEVTGCASR